MTDSFHARSARVLIVDDEPAHRFAVREAVKKMQRPHAEAILAQSLSHALDLLDQTDIDVCLCDYELWDNATALDLLRSAHGHGHRIPFVAVTGVVDEDPLAHELLIAGFDDVLHKNDLHDANLYRIVRNSWLRNVRSRQVEENATRDYLTGLQNRRSLEARLQVECDRAERNQSHLSVLFLDLNHFKALNDQYGHGAGDEALCHIANLLVEAVRKTDVVARLGGDEFVVVLPECSGGKAQTLSEKLRKSIEEKPVEFEDKTIPLSVSVGAVLYDKETGMDRPKALLHAADAAMYYDKGKRRAKRGG